MTQNQFKINDSSSLDKPNWLLVECVPVVMLFLVTLKVKVGFLCSTAYTKTGPACFTISEVAAHRQEPSTHSPDGDTLFEVADIW